MHLKYRNKYEGAVAAMREAPVWNVEISISTNATTYFECHNRRMYKSIERDEVRDVFQNKVLQLNECPTAWQKKGGKGDRYRSSLGHLWKVQEWSLANKSHHFRRWQVREIDRIQIKKALSNSIKDVNIIYKAFGSAEGFKQEYYNQIW